MTDDHVPRIEQIGSTALAHLALGRNLFLSGLYGRALEELNQALQGNPELELAHFLVGVIHGVRGEYEEGCEQLRTAIELEPDYCAAWVALGHLELQLGHFEEALCATGEGIRCDPQHARAHAQRGDILRTMKCHADAAEAYRESVRLAPAMTAPRYKLAQELVELGREDDAMAQTLRAQRFNPLDPRSRVQAGDLLAAAGRIEEAIVEYRGAAQLQISLAAPSSVPLRKWGQILFEQDRLLEAMPLLRGAVGINPKDVDAMVSLARILIRLGRYEEAIEMGRAALAQDEAFTDAKAVVDEAEQGAAGASAEHTGLEDALGRDGTPPAILGLDTPAE